MPTRIAFNIALAVSLLFLPWWLGALILAAACLTVPGFYEAIAFGVLSDALYGTSMGAHGFPYPATAFAVVVFLISAYLRGKLAWQ